MDIIIGAGVSGLSYAAKTNNDYLILEQSDSIGGYCKTIYSKDYIWDYSGHFFHFQHPDIKNFVMQHLSEEEILKVYKFTQIYYNGNMVDYPFQMNIHQLEKEEFIDCLYDLFITSNNPHYDTFKDMLYAKFGKSIAEKFLIPYNEKLYATDLNKLDVDAMGRFFPYANKDEIVKNFRNPENNSYNAFFLYPKKGCIKIVESIASHVNPLKINFNEKVTSINIEKKWVITNKRVLPFDNLISTMPFPKLLDNCNIIYNKDIYSWNKVLVFNLGFDKKGCDLRNNWIYFPNKDLIFYRVGFYDNIIGQNKMSLYVELGFSYQQDEIDKEYYLQRVLNDLKQVGIIDNHQLVDYKAIIMDPAYVHITKESEQDKKIKMTELAQYNIYSIGRYGEWKYCSLEDNIADAFSLAERTKPQQLNHYKIPQN